MIDRDKAIAVVGANNGSSSTLPRLLMHSYNGISVGRTDGNHSAGFTTIDGAGRIKPEIVVPQSATSYATPVVGAAAALLLEQANTSAMTDATNPETVKAILLAGATKSEFPSWDRTTTRPLDDIYGAGELNVYRSYHILTAGEQPASPSSVVAAQGWDFNATTAGSNYYFFDVAANTALSELSALLTWHRVITDGDPVSPTIWDPQSSLADLNLKLYSASGFTLGSLLDSSLSTVDNLEHVYFSSGTTALRAGRYALEVSAAAAGTDYGLAWLNTSFLIGDMNGDGLVNNFDLGPFEMALTDPSGYSSLYPSLTNYGVRGDVNGDLVFNNFDIGPFETLLTASALAVPEPSTLVLLAVGGLGALGAGRWRRRRRS
jgi:hypothetical protein